MPSGTLYAYLKEPTTISASTRVELAKGVADGLKYLHSENVVHGDLHPANVLIDSSGSPRLTDFGLAAVPGDANLQLSTMTVNRNLDSRWRAPEVIGIEYNPERPTFKSDIYSFGGAMFFIISGDIPWKEKKHSHQISIELSKAAIHERPVAILDDHWNLIQKCWSSNPENRPKVAEVIRSIATKNAIVFEESGVGKPTIEENLPRRAPRWFQWLAHLFSKKVANK
ncbi:kinase-like domain-containing protein [Suillus ampliporus]|nr:kinase-like domain-containing protein [Suillus ampliporus]